MLRAHTCPLGVAEAPKSRAANGRREAMRSTLDYGGAAPHNSRATPATTPSFASHSTTSHVSTAKSTVDDGNQDQKRVQELRISALPRTPGTTADGSTRDARMRSSRCRNVVLAEQPRGVARVPSKGRPLPARTCPPHNFARNTPRAPKTLAHHSIHKTITSECVEGPTRSFDLPILI